jgi:hypothetical protein
MCSITSYLLHMIYCCVFLIWIWAEWLICNSPKFQWGVNIQSVPLVVLYCCRSSTNYAKNNKEIVPIHPVAVPTHVWGLFSARALHSLCGEIFVWFCTQSA